MTQEPYESEPSSGPDLPKASYPEGQHNQEDPSPQEFMTGTGDGQFSDSSRYGSAGMTGPIHVGPQMGDDMEPPKRGAAITSLILGIISLALGIIPVSLCGCCMILEAIPIVGGIVAVVMGMIYLNAPESIPDLEGRKTAKAGVITGSVGVCFAILWSLITFSMMFVPALIGPTTNQNQAVPLTPPIQANPPIIIPSTQPADLDTHETGQE